MAVHPAIPIGMPQANQARLARTRSQGEGELGFEEGGHFSLLSARIDDYPNPQRLPPMAVS